MQATTTPENFSGKDGCTYHYVGGTEKPYRKYQPNQHIPTSNKYKAVTQQEVDRAYKEWLSCEEVNTIDDDAGPEPIAYTADPTITTGKGAARAKDFAALLEAARVRPTDVIEPAPVCLAIEDNGQQYRVGTLGNISTVTGKAKSKKTFAVSFAVAAAVGSTLVIDRIRGQLPAGKQNVLLFDTEQSSEDVQNVVKRICSLANNDNPQNLFPYSLRGLHPNERLGAIDYAINSTPNVGLVVIDGVRDLAIDPILDSTQASHVMTKLLQWSDRFHIHVLCVLHENKHDKTLRGFLGTELVNKSETVLSVMKSADDKDISTVTAEYCRGREFEPFSFSVDDNGFPSLVNARTTDMLPKRKRKPKAADFTSEQVESMCRRAFDTVAQLGYKELQTNLIEAAQHNGLDLARSRAEELIRRIHLQEYVLKCRPENARFDVYQINPDKLSAQPS